MVVIACTMIAVSEPVAFGQLAAEKEPRVSEPSTASPGAPASAKGTQNEQVVVHPTEGYFAAFGGYTFGGKFDAEGVGLLNGASSVTAAWPILLWSVRKLGDFFLSHSIGLA